MNELTKEKTASLIAESSDLSLILDKQGIIRDVAIGSEDDQLKSAKSLVGKRWADVVAVDSVKKVKQLLEVGDSSDRPRWREINLLIDGQDSLPILFKTVALDADQGAVAFGRDLRPVSRLQQRILDVQHSLEQDYARLHQAETRYRMLFSMAAEAILIVDADTRKIVEANPAAGRLLDLPAGKLVNRRFPRGFSDNSVDAINDLLTRVRAAGRAEDIIVRSANSDHGFRLAATLIRREDGPFFLVRIIDPGMENSDGVSHKIIDIVNRAPDAFVVTDPDGRILAANEAFLDLCQVATELQVRGEPVERWLGRPGVDTNLLLRNLRERGQVRNFSTTINPEFGSEVEIEVSAVSALDSDDPCFGFVMRSHLASQRSESPDDGETLPRSLKEITDLVGRVPLKDLVRETTDIIERMCIEAALKLTNDSRASAAEMLGLSRQSLYVKLRRYGISESESNNS